MEHIKICIHVTKFDLSQVQLVYVFCFSTKNVNYLQNSVHTHGLLQNTVVYLSTSMFFFFKKKFVLYLVQPGKENDTTGVWYVMESSSLNSITEIMLTAPKWKPSVEVLENFRSIGLYIKK